jgi:tetratricopeptide (TPR) repeat protein
MIEIYAPCFVSAYLKSGLVVAALIALAPVPAAAETGPTPKLPELKPLTASPQSMTQARREMLSNFYDQLQKAQSEESANRIILAIEKLWSQSGSDTVDLLMERAGLATKARNYKLAAAILSALTEIEPRFAEGWNQLATIYFLEDNYIEAMQQLRRVLAIDPRHFKAIEGLGIILRETGNKKAALEVTRRALAINPYLKSAKQAAEELEREVEGQGI